MAHENFWQKTDRLSREAAQAFTAVGAFLQSGPDLDDEDVKLELWELQNSALVAAEAFKEHYFSLLGGGGGMDSGG